MSNTVVKMKCDSVTHTLSGGEVKLVPVTGGSPENESFFKWTPYGEFKMGTINEAVIGMFVPGNEYMVTIRKADNAAE